MAEKKFECNHCAKTFATAERAHLHLRYIHRADSRDFRRIGEPSQSSWWGCSCFEGFTRPASTKPAKVAEIAGSDEHPSALRGNSTLKKVKVEYETDNKGPLVDPANCMCKKDPCVCEPCLCGRSTVCVCNGGADF
mmetsp:Transcript_11039/g.20793  ORF Transcript_11039/g.20793 Transcript_11039/m.20793 type:complete len:136 (+) Transcript_11039:57-464(+)